MPVNIAQEAIIAYTRIEPRAIARDYKPTVKAQVHDALWMLTQQFRVGEFKGDDAGTLVKARVATQSAKINRFKGRNGAVEAFDEAVPLEAKVERLPLRFDLGFSLELSAVWYKLLKKTYPVDAETIFASFKEAFPIIQVNAGQPEKSSNTPAVQIRNLAAKRAVDGATLYQALVGGADPNLIAPGFPLLSNLKAKFLVWFDNTYYYPATDQDNSWSEKQLEYQCAVSVPMNTSPTADQQVLQADKYKQGTMDWYSFDLDKNVNAKLQEDPGVIIDNAAAILPRSVFSYIPVNIEFKGMPKGRWWEFEDQHNDLSKMLTQKQDVSKMVVMEFGLIYSNDWFIIPHIVPDATLTEVEALVATDVFGRQFMVERAGSGIEDQWQRWDMYNISRNGIGQVETFGKLLMIPSVKNRMESEPLEKVMFLRDEMANMIWGVEDVVPNELLGGMDGKNANNELQRYLASVYTPPEDPEYIANAALHRFRLSNSVPENWIPFVPKQVPDPSDFQGRKVLLQRAVMRRYISDNLTNDLIRPRTNILLYGIKEVIYHNFADGMLHDWQPYGSGQLTAEAANARLRIAVTSMDSGAMIDFDTIPGKRYRVYFDLDAGTFVPTAIVCALQNTVGAGFITNITVNDSANGLSMEFVATSSLVTLLIEATVDINAAFYISNFHIAINDPYFLHEEETGRQGFIISTNYQRSRWYDGRTYTWMGRKVLSGKGEGNSGLKFDILADKESDFEIE